MYGIYLQRHVLFCICLLSNHLKHSWMWRLNYIFIGLMSSTLFVILPNFTADYSLTLYYNKLITVKQNHIYRWAVEIWQMEYSTDCCEAYYISRCCNMQIGRVIVHWIDDRMVVCDINVHRQPCIYIYIYVFNYRASVTRIFV